MRTVSPGPQYGERSQGWLRGAFLDEPEVRSLNAFICELASTRELHDALRLISEEVRSFLGARFVAVVVFDDDGQEQAGDLVDPAAIGVPLRVAGRQIGEITAYLDQPRELTHSEARAIEVIAAVAAVTLDNARWLQRERKRLSLAEAVNGLAPRIAATQSREELARLVVMALKDLLHYDAARLLWRNGEGDDVVCLAVAHGAGNGHAVEHSWQDSGVASRVLREGSPVLVSDQGGRREIGGSANAALRSLLAVPVRGSRAVSGVLEVGARSPRAFDEADLSALTSLAAQVAVVGDRLGKAGHDPTRPGHDHDRGRNELISVIVHDLRGPLSIVKGSAATLLRLGESADREKRRRFLTGIDQAVDRMTTMVDHLAGVSRLESGQLQLQLRQVDLSDLVTETVEKLRPKLGEHPISLELPGETLLVDVDWEQIDRALGNLLLSAVRQSPADGRITVSIGAQIGAIRAWSSSVISTHSRVVALGQEYGIVEVRSEGQGLPREYLNKVFDKFFHFPNVGGRKKGSGLELYVSKKIVEAHGGQVWADSELGHGTCFGFSVPLSILDQHELGN